MLLDNNLLGSGGDLGIDFDTRFPVHQTGPIRNRRPEVGEAPHVAAVAPVSVGGVYDTDAMFTTETERTLEGRKHSAPSRRFHQSTWGDKVVLHIHHNQGSPAGINPFNSIRHKATSFLSHRTKLSGKRALLL